MKKSFSKLLFLFVLLVCSLGMMGSVSALTDWSANYSDWYYLNYKANFSMIDATGVFNGNAVTNPQYGVDQNGSANNTFDFGSASWFVNGTATSFKPDSNTDWSVSLWYYATDSAAQYTLFGQHQTTNDANFLIAAFRADTRCNSVKGIYVDCYDGTTDNYACNAMVPQVNEWTHLVITYNSSATNLSWYVNDVLNYTSLTNCVNSAPGFNENAIGSLLSGGTGYNIMNGQIDEVLVLNRTVDQANVDYLFVNWNNYDDVPVALVLDTIVPYVSITSPANTTYSSLNVSLDFTAQDETLLDQCSYSFDYGATNFSTPCNLTTTLLASEGANDLRIYANDTSNNDNFTQVSFTIDSVIPTITISSPINQTYSNVSSVNIDFVPSDIALDQCWYSLDAGNTNVSIANCANTTLNTVFGNTDFIIFANDTTNNVGNSSTISFIDAAFPSLIINYPYDNYHDSATLNASLTYVSEDSGISANCSIFKNESFEMSYDGTLTNNTAFSMNITSLSDEIISWNVSCTNQYGLEGWSSTQTFVYDTIYPIITKIAPTLTYTNAQSLYLNYTASDSFLYFMNVSVINSTNDLVYSRYEEDYNSSATTLAWINDTINLQEDGNYTVNVKAGDSHTRGSIKGLNNTVTDDNNNIKWFNYDNDLFNTSFGMENPSGNFVSLQNKNVVANITYDDVLKAYKFGWCFDLPNPSFTVSIKVSAMNNKVLKYLDWSSYKGHFVIDEYYLDFQDVIGSGLSIDSVENVGGEYYLRISGFPNNGRVCIDPEAGANNIAETNDTIILDTILPYIDVQSPANNSYFDTSVDLNFTSGDDYTIDACWYTTPAGANTTLTNCGNTTIVPVEGLNNLTFWANDTAGNINQSNEIFFTVDNTNPVVDFSAEVFVNNVFVKSTELIINLTYTETNYNYTIFSFANETNDLNVYESVNTNYTFTLLNDGGWFYNATMFDMVLRNTVTGNRNLTLDTIIPAISFVDVVDAKNTSVNDFEVNISVTDLNLGWNNYSLFQSDGTFLGSVNSTINNLTSLLPFDGAYLFNVTHYDLADNENSTATYAIALDTIPPSMTLSEPANATVYSTPNMSIDFVVGMDDAESCWYNLNTDANYFVACDANTTVNVTAGENNITFSANDSLNNINISSVITFEMYNESPVISGLVNVSGLNSNIVTWNTSVVSNSSIMLTNTTVFEETSYSTTHSINITGLDSGLNYYFNITTCTKNNLCSVSENLLFITLNTPSDDEPSSSGGGGTASGGTMFSSTNSSSPDIVYPKAIICAIVHNYSINGVERCYSCPNGTLVRADNAYTYVCMACKTGFYYNPDNGKCELISKITEFKQTNFLRNINNIKPEFIMIAGIAIIGGTAYFGAGGGKTW